MTVSLIRCTIAGAVRRPTPPVRPTSRPPPSAAVTPVPTPEAQCKDRESRSRCDWPQSPSNILLICVQRPDATRVGGIRTWNSLGRRVNRGEHGIAILAPCIYRAAPGETPTADQGPDIASATPALLKPTANTDGAIRQLRGFKVVHVFDVSQTNGDPLPDAGPTHLTGPTPDGLWDHLAGLVGEDGYRIERGPCRFGANGYTDFTARVVRVRDDVDPSQAAKTLAHELGHIRADHEHRFTDYATSAACRGQAEVEAESIAYLITAQAGLDSASYSLPYLASWSGGSTDLLIASMARVTSVARTVDASPFGGQVHALEADAQLPESPPSASWKQPRQVAPRVELSASASVNR
ncbi:ImmA/IrrE family metallo-endopeptidase [Cellulomonas sp. KRMCY2]|uniref:ImmA/IrrE family metallo-endopeptidase n=1 Tax=Cellulomonas sp. KRMCY2 TaxID=1304865 RepID=UPI0012DF29BD|nr:ImmA/IrrE family metallo-endopeptidase [Cellulomonas sp. KRMCY2]